MSRSSSSSSSSSSTYSIGSLLKKTEHYDKDERYMATSDLCELLKRQGNIINNNSSSSSNNNSNNSSSSSNHHQHQHQQQQKIFDSSMERRVCTAVLRLLHDKSNDVQAVAVKTLGVLLTTVPQELVLEIADSLTDQVLDAGKSELRDVYAIGLRTLVKTIPLGMGDRTGDRLVGRLLDGIRSSSSSSTDSNNDETTTSPPSKEREEIVLSCLDILTDLLGRFGATSVSVTRQHEPVLQICLKLISNKDGSNNNTKNTNNDNDNNNNNANNTNTSAVVRKRAGNALGCLSVVLSDALLVSAVERLLSQIEESGAAGAGAGTTSSTNAGNNENTRALIRTMCTVSGAVGHRLQQPQIDRILPIFLKFTNPEKALTGDDDDDDDNGDGNDADNHNNDNANANGDDEDAAMMEDENDDNASQNTSSDAAVAMANELRESCFMGFESFVQKCPTQVEPHLDKIVQAALAYMSYDPNYSYGVDDEDNKNTGNGMDEDGDGDDDDYGCDDDDEYGDDDGDDGDDFYDDDDDDESWKVRRSAIRALTAVVETKQHDPGFLWSRSYTIRKMKKSSQKVQSVDCVASALVARFKEREENCRVGILETFTKLMEITIKKATTATTATATSSSSSDGEHGGGGTTLRFSSSAAGDDATMEDNNSSVVVVDLRNKYAPALVKACEKLLAVKKGGERSKSYALSLLSTLCKAPGGVGGQDEILSVFQHVQTFLGSDADDDDDKNENNNSNNTTSKALRLDALSLIVAMLESNNHNPVHVRKGLALALLPQLCSTVKEQWYKVIAEALRALAAVPKFFGTTNTNTEAATTTTEKEETDAVANRLYGSIEPLLAAHDVDQEIKECALMATASLLSELGHDHLSQDQTKRLNTLLLERLKNETTRIPAIKTLSAISSSSSDIDLSGILSDSIQAMAGFLKMSSRSLRQTSLEALDVVIIHHGHTITGTTTDAKDLYSSLLCELSDLVVDSDLHISHLALRASISALKVCPACGTSIKDHLLPKVLALSSSPLLQDLALDSLLAHLEQVVISNAVEFKELLGMLRGRLEQESLSKHAIYNLAQCIAVIASATSPENQQGVVMECLQTLENSPTPTGSDAELKKVQLALLVSGDLGRMIDLGSVSADVPEKLNTIYMGYFESPSEDLKNASSYALGRAAVGAQSVFLPAIVDSLEENNSERKQYLLLSALRGFIQSSYQQSGGESIASTLPVIMPHLESHACDEKEGVRTMVAECLGSLTCMQPTLMSEKLCTMAEDHSSIVVTETGTIDPEDADSKKNALVCWTVAISIKHAIAGKADQAKLAVFVPRFLKLLEQKELGARNAALLMVYSAVHHMPQLVSGVMKDQITPALYEVATFQLKRKIDLGPFKHTVDDALPLRKAALSIFATCLENLPGSLDIAAFMPVLAKTLSDVEDIQLQAHQIVIAMCLRQPTYVIAAVETFVEPLEKTLFKKQGAKTGTELERLVDWKKSSLRAMVALSRVEGTLNSRKFAEFVERTQANTKFRSALDAIDEER